MAYSECLPTRLNPLAERTCFSQVPGSPAGWLEMLGRYGSGRLSAAEVFAPAVALAEGGFPCPGTPGAVRHPLRFPTVNRSYVARC